MNALQLYTKAGLLERQGNLSEALQLYRQAYKLDPQVEDHVRSELKAKPATSLSEASSDGGVTNNELLSQPQQPVDLDGLLLSFKSMEITVQKAHSHRNRTHISALPPEIMLKFVLYHLIQQDAQSLEAFGQTCKQFYYYARDQLLWKSLCNNSSEVPDYRQLYLNTPRVRTDGVYIMRYTYTRQGRSEMTFTQPIHLVTYYRYYRFFKNGKVLSLLSTTEPVKAIQQITLAQYNVQQQSKKERHVSQPNNYSTESDRLMLGTISLVVGDKDARLEVQVRDQAHRPGIIFCSQFKLVSSYQGGWNKLIYQAYYGLRESVRTEFPIKNYKPCYFSRVKSFVIN